MYKKTLYIIEIYNNIFEYFYSQFDHFVKYISKINIKLYCDNINKIINKNLIIVKDLNINSNTNKIKKY